jgi:Dolichyl-phosphate-mannose-protein mannosyltransferase
MPKQSHWRPALLLFLGASVLFWFSIGDRLLLNVDEGIYLDGALRSYNGETVFRDFAAQTGPGTFWLCDLCFRLFGVSLRSARIPLFLGLAAMVAGVFFLTAELTTRSFALAVTVAFILIETSNGYLLAVNHRWDSGALAFLAVIFAFTAIRRRSRALSFSAGACAAAAAWITPSIWLIAIPLACWMLFHRDLRRLIAPLIAGSALVTAICGGVLATEGALGPMVSNLLWTARNYTAPNRMPFGYAGSGYTDGVAGFGLLAKALLYVVLAWLYWPAVLPVLAYCGWAAWFLLRRPDRSSNQREIVFVLTCSCALLASTYPRWDIGHLLYVAPVFYVLLATLMFWAVPRQWMKLLGVILWPLGLFVAWQPLAGAREYSRILTPSGPVSALPRERAFVGSLLAHIRAGEGLFVFPNFPSVYFLTRGANPTQYPSLLAGLMTEDDERVVIRELEAKPPRWVVYWEVSPERLLMTLPSIDPARLRFHIVENYLLTHYRMVATNEYGRGPYSVLERRDRKDAGL